MKPCVTSQPAFWSALILDSNKVDALEMEKVGGRPGLCLPCGEMVGMPLEGAGGALPFGLMRLSVLINLSVFNVGVLVGSLMNEAIRIGARIRDSNRPHELVDDETIIRIKAILDMADQSAEEFQWQSVRFRVERFNRKLKSSEFEYSQANIQIIALKDAVDDGLKNQFIYRYPNDKVELLSNWKNDWGAVLVRFPECRKDIRAGVDLWALEHSTASVFHMMRVLEIGLGALAENVDVVFSVQVWHNVLNEIEAAIKTQAKSLPRGEEKNARLQFLSESAKEFAHFKDGWRNYVAHNKCDYDEHQARGVIEHVRQFMTVLANNLSENSVD